MDSEREQRSIQSRGRQFMGQAQNRNTGTLCKSCFLKSIQMLSIAFLLLSPDNRTSFSGVLADSGVLLLSIAAYLSLYSLALYFKNAWKYL